MGAITLRAHKEAKKVEAKKMPLGSIYSTSAQKGLKVIGENLGDLGSVTVGASNAFLVRADDLRGALRATQRALVAGYPVDEPVTAEGQSKSTEHWLVVYFGVAGSDPPAWSVKSVEMTPTDVTLTYAKSTSETDDEHQYMAFVPLGKLEPGTFTLQLFDQDRKYITLLRRVRIGAH